MMMYRRHPFIGVVHGFLFNFQEYAQGKARFICEYCVPKALLWGPAARGFAEIPPAEFRTMRQYFQHVLHYHMPLSRMWRCPVLVSKDAVCGHLFRNEDALREHLRRNHFTGRSSVKGKMDQVMLHASRVPDSPIIPNPYYRPPSNFHGQGKYPPFHPWPLHDQLYADYEAWQVVMQVVQWLPKYEKWRTLIRLYSSHIPFKLLGITEEVIKWAPLYYGPELISKVSAVCPVLTMRNTKLKDDKMVTFSTPPWKSFVSFIDMGSTAVEKILEGVCASAAKPDCRIF